MLVNGFGVNLKMVKMFSSLSSILDLKFYSEKKQLLDSIVINLRGKWARWNSTVLCYQRDVQNFTHIFMTNFADSKSVFNFDQ